MWFLWLGPSGSEEALEPVSYPVWQQRRKPLRCPAFSLLHSFLHHRGTGLLQHRQPHRTHERQGLPRRRRLYLKVRQPLRLTTTLLQSPARPTSPVKTAAWLEHCVKQGNSPLPLVTITGTMSEETDCILKPPEGNCHLSVTPTQAL